MNKQKDKRNQIANDSRFYALVEMVEENGDLIEKVEGVMEESVQSTLEGRLEKMELDEFGDTIFLQDWAQLAGKFPRTFSLGLGYIYS